MATQKEEEQGHKGAKHEGGGFWHLFGRAALSVVLGIVLAFLLPTRFGEEMGAQTMARYAAPFSGYLFDREREKAVDKEQSDWHGKSITVLVIDAEVLAACKEGWPAHYPFTAGSGISQQVSAEGCFYRCDSFPVQGTGCRETQETQQTRMY